MYQVSIMGSLVLGGSILMLGDPGRAQRMLGIDLGVDVGLMAAFATVFALAGLSRLWSVHFLRMQGEAPGLDVRSHRRVPMRELAGRVQRRHDGRLLGSMVAMTVAVQVAQPFFTPYMSRHLGFGDAEVLAAIAVGFAAKSLVAPLWGRWAQRNGARSLFIVGALGVVPLSALWMVSPSFWYLLGLQALTGAAFGAFELGFFFLALESIREEERTSMMTSFMVLNSFAAAAGSLVGSALLGRGEVTTAAYMTVFAASAAARVFAFATVASVREDVAHAAPMATQPIALRPSAGSIDMPEPASIAEEDAR
jgi:MFS family permease